MTPLASQRLGVREGAEPSVEHTPGYHLGFYDAQAGEPLFGDAAPEYCIGWKAYWRARTVLEKTVYDPIRSSQR